MWPKSGPRLNQVTFHKLGKGLLDNNSYQISRFFACNGPDKCQCKGCWGWGLLVPVAYLNNLVVYKGLYPPSLMKLAF